MRHSTHYMPYTQVSFWPEGVIPQRLEAHEVSLQNGYEIWRLTLKANQGLPSHYHKQPAIILVSRGEVIVSSHGDNANSNVNETVVAGTPKSIAQLQHVAIRTKEGAEIVVVTHIGDITSDSTTFWAEEEAKE